MGSMKMSCKLSGTEVYFNYYNSVCFVHN